MEDFCIQVSQIAHDEDEDWLDNTDVVGEARDETGQKAPDDADQRTAERHHQEGSKTGQNVGVFDIFDAHADVSVKHIV